MIQRIQSLHLLAATVLTAMLLVMPLAWYADCGRTVTLYAFGLQTTTEYAADNAPTASKTAVHETVTSEVVVSEVAVSEVAAAKTIAHETVTSEVVVSEVAVSEVAAAETIAHETVTSEVVVSEVAVSEVAAAETAAPEPVADDTTREALPLYLGILLLIASVLPLATIFCYERRQLQIRLCAVEIVLLLGVLAMEVIYYFRFKALFADLATTASHVSAKLTMAFPLLALFLVWLAVRAIFRDEMLVRAADRIR